MFVSQRLSLVIVSTSRAVSNKNWKMQKFQARLSQTDHHHMRPLWDLSWLIILKALAEAALIVKVCTMPMLPTFGTLLNKT